MSEHLDIQISSQLLEVSRRKGGKPPIKAESGREIPHFFSGSTTIMTLPQTSEGRRLRLLVSSAPPPSRPVAMWLQSQNSSTLSLATLEFQQKNKPWNSGHHWSLFTVCATWTQTNTVQTRLLYMKLCSFGVMTLLPRLCSQSHIKQTDRTYTVQSRLLYNRLCSLGVWDMALQLGSVEILELCSQEP